MNLERGTLNNKTIVTIVTGGTGFAGSNLVKLFNEYSYKNIIVDHFTIIGTHEWQGFIEDYRRRKTHYDDIGSPYAYDEELNINLVL